METIKNLQEVNEQSRQEQERLREDLCKTNEDLRSVETDVSQEVRVKYSRERLPRAFLVGYYE